VLQANALMGACPHFSPVMSIIFMSMDPPSEIHVYNVHTGWKRNVIQISKTKYMNKLFCMQAGGHPAAD
jgi:hypothetical protein